MCCGCVPGRVIDAGFSSPFVNQRSATRLRAVFKSRVLLETRRVFYHKLALDKAKIGPK